MLESKDVVKKYMGKVAVDHLSTTLEPGHIYGLLGPNGSGKSTWMKMVAALIVPTSGTITLNGEPVGTKSKQIIAYMPTEPFYYSYMKIVDVGLYYSDFFEGFDHGKFARLIQSMELNMNDKVSTLSSGQAAKLKLAATLSRKAEIYLLDEPLNGIDLLAREEIIHTILEALDDTSVAVISSHLVEELEKVIDRVIFVKNGQIALAGDVEELRKTQNKSVVELYRELYQ